MSIEIKNLTKSFEDKKIFDGFSYTFPDTGIFALVGQSGIGKTTLLRIISGLDRDYSGEIIKGDLRFSFAFQEYRLFPELSALDNVIVPNFDKATEEQMNICKDILEDFGFTAKEFNLYPSELSGGMKQRVSLARAFVNSAEVLLLDEPTKELDDANAKKALERIKSEAKTRLVVIVTHNLSDIEYLDANIIEFK